MKDPRIANLARILVQYSIDARKGQTIAVTADSAAEPLVVAVYEELLAVGAFPALNLHPDGVDELLLKKGKPHHFTTVTSYQKAVVRHVDATIRIRAQTNTRALSATQPRRQAQLTKAQRPLKNVILKKPWVLTLFPTAAYAQDADMSLSEFEDFVYEATYATRTRPVASWKALRRRQEKLIGKLAGADEIRIVGPGTDLRFSVKDRPFINSDGRHNMPSGEVFTSPLAATAEGEITYDYPVCHGGREIEGVRLVFRGGWVVEASATKNEGFLKAMLDTDPGARRLGELGIGTNEQIQRFTRNILFDEKIGGTVHLALGQAYAEAGGRNKSAIHWDMIKDLRRGGAVYVDGTVFQKDGRFA